jgi:hypothetical protein
LRVLGVNPDSYTTDGRQLVLAKELLESVRNGIVRDDFLSYSRPIGADVYLSGEK